MGNFADFGSFFAFLTIFEPQYLQMFQLQIFNKHQLGFSENANRPHLDEIVRIYGEKIPKQTSALEA